MEKYQVAFGYTNDEENFNEIIEGKNTEEVKDYIYSNFNDDEKGDIDIVSVEKVII